MYKRQGCRRQSDVGWKKNCVPSCPGGKLMKARCPIRETPSRTKWWRPPQPTWASPMYGVENDPARDLTAPDSRAMSTSSLIHISEPTRLRRISYAVFCLKKKKKQ